jgi:sugar phosphate isomerase/epimerase
MKNLSRRDFLSRTSASLAAAGLLGPLSSNAAFCAEKRGSKMKLGLVTYRWAEKWDLDTIIKNLEASGVLGVELRTTHEHGVDLHLSKQQRVDVKKKFDDSPAVLVGIGSDERFDSPDAAKLKAAIEATKKYVVLSKDLGASGVKVKPNDLHKEIDRKITLDQIGNALNEVGQFAGEYGQEIRLEVHGNCAAPPIMREIMDRVTDPNVGICWNSNPHDLKGQGLRHNFDLLKDRLGYTTHTRYLDYPKYPFQELIDMMVAIDYDGWLLMECTNKLDDPVAELARNQKLMAQMIAKAQAKLG